MSRPDQQVSLSAWTNFVTAHAGGGVLDGRVVKVLPFGALVEVAEGIQGLLPRSTWSAEPQAGSRIPVRIDTLDVQRRRMSLVPA
jgi:small subunit ribosomal protein S1